MLEKLLIFLTIAAFVAILLLSFYFRLKVLKAYKILVRNRVQFGQEHLFNKKRLEEEIVPNYPQFEKEIYQFVNGIRLSMRLASVLIFIITLCGGVLMYFRS